MSVQVSYKKQTLLGFIGLLILFLSIEAIANVWWVTQITCEFEENEIFAQMNDSKKRQLCVDLYEIKTSGTELIPNQQNQSITINSLGFRGDDFSFEKPMDVYRIFMLGGSTMFGHGATSDNTTIPGYLQNLFKNYNNDFTVEIINSGIQGADSFNELNLIETKLIDYSPDMLIIYDGWNDLRAQHSPDTIYDNWNSMCNLGKENKINVIVSLQPIAGFGEKSLTEQELEYSQKGMNYGGTPLIASLNDYQQYAQKLDALSRCDESLDLRNIFDTEISPIYWDQGHVSDVGNSIVARAIYDKILPLLPENIPKSEYSSNDIDVKPTSTLENELRYIVSIYKTPIMISSFFSFDSISIPSDNEPLDSESNNSIFETQSKLYESENISILIEIIKNKNNPQEKILKFKTLNTSNNKEVSHVTYFLKISKEDKLILSDFFYTETDTLSLNVSTNNSESIVIFGERKYDHNALLTNSESPVKLTGPLLEDNVTYDVNIELRTIYDTSNWVFVLDNFNAKIKS
jgi:lysophospholipase L1-like esterase